MRILHWYPNFMGGGGVSNAVLGLSVNEARLGADVAIAAASLCGPPLYEYMGGEREVTLLEWAPRWAVKYRGFVLRRISKRAGQGLQAFHPDVVHVHGEFNADNLWVPHLFRCPVVLSPHGGFRAIDGAKGRRLLRAAYFRVARALFYRQVSAVHTLSPTERECVRRVLPDRRVYCVPQGPSLRTPLSEAPELQRAPNGRVDFVFVGRLDVSTKGLDILLDAFAAAGRQLHGQETTLTLVGPDWKGGRAWLQERASALGIAERIVFTGPLPGPEVVSTLYRSQVYVQLSRSDCFPLSVSEALLAGKPAILSEGVGQASYPEVASLPHVRVVSPSVAEATAAMVDFAGRVGLLRFRAQQCQTRVREFFSWERVARLQLQMYRNVLSEHHAALKTRSLTGAEH
jgi:glycosyltransferase involved in cell wall biosynthesis